MEAGKSSFRGAGEGDAENCGLVLDGRVLEDVLGDVLLGDSIGIMGEVLRGS